MRYTPYMTALTSKAHGLSPDPMTVEPMATSVDPAVDASWTELGLRAIACPRRRAVLRYLELREQATIAEVVGHLTASATEPERRRHLEVKLHHLDLPMLADSGLLEWDPNEGVIHRGPGWARVGSLRQLADDVA